MIPSASTSDHVGVHPPDSHPSVPIPRHAKLLLTTPADSQLPGKPSKSKGKGAKEAKGREQRPSGELRPVFDRFAYLDLIVRNQATSLRLESPMVH